jgi:hypothetical protein
MVAVGRDSEAPRLRWGMDGMSSGKTVVLLLAWIALSIGVASLGIAGAPKTVLIKQYWGKIASVRIDKCGKRPGLCEGMIILARRDGAPVTLAIRPGTWIKRSDHLVVLEELSVGNEVHVQAIEIVGEGPPRATTVDVPANP